jgi:4'-phosphopantetheinyl transferase
MTTQEAISYCPKGQNMLFAPVSRTTRCTEADSGVTVYVRRVTGDPSAAARKLLRRAAATRLRMPEETIAVEREPGGRPRLGGPAAHLHVSVSHTGSLVAVALTALAPVGVDVELARPVPVLDLARRWFTADEAAWVGRQPGAHRTTAFLLLWTAKEAMGKAYGTGLRGDGLRRPAPLPSQWPVPLPGQWSVPLPGRWPVPWSDALLRPVPGEPSLVLARPAAPDGAVLAVACAGAHAAGVEVVVHRVRNSRRHHTG